MLCYRCIQIRDTLVLLILGASVEKEDHKSGGQDDYWDRHPSCYGGCIGGAFGYLCGLR